MDDTTFDSLISLTDVSFVFQQLSQSFIMESNHSEGTRMPYKEIFFFRPAEKISVKFIDRN